MNLKIESWINWLWSIATFHWGKSAFILAFLFLVVLASFRTGITTVRVAPKPWPEKDSDDDKESK